MPFAFFSGPDMLIIVVLVVILFGGKQVPQLMRSIGQGMGELQKGLEEAKRTVYMASQEAKSAIAVDPAVVRPSVEEAQAQEPLPAESTPHGYPDSR